MSRDCFIAYKSDSLLGTFVRRVKRFSIEIIASERSLWIHTNNSGSMLGLLRKGEPILASKATNPKRKLAYTLEAVWLGAPNNGFWVGVNTLIPNQMLKKAHSLQALPFLPPHSFFTAEKSFRESRLDGYVQSSACECYIECKNVTLVEDDCALFPDSPSKRACKHLTTLMEIKSLGKRAVLFFCVQRPDARCYGPADMIDPAYARLFWEAQRMGVEMYCHRLTVTEQGIGLAEAIPLLAEPAVLF